MDYQEIKETLTSMGAEGQVEMSAARKVLQYLELATEMQREICRDLERKYVETEEFKKMCEKYSHE